MTERRLCATCGKYEDGGECRCSVEVRVQGRPWAGLRFRWNPLERSQQLECRYGNRSIFVRRIHTGVPYEWRWEWQAIEARGEEYETVRDAAGSAAAFIEAITRNHRRSRAKLMAYKYMLRARELRQRTLRSPFAIGVELEKHQTHLTWCLFHARKLERLVTVLRTYSEQL